MNMEPVRVLVADPPWSFSDKLPKESGGADKHYRTMGVQAICDFDLPPLADNALLFLWRVAAMTEESMRVCRAWGFVPKAELVWLKRTPSGKLRFGMGRYTRACHEVCIIASRGRGNSLVKNRGIRSVFDAEAGVHSRKPDEFYSIVESIADGPYHELFARRSRPGWSCEGDQVGLVP